MEEVELEPELEVSLPLFLGIMYPPLLLVEVDVVGLGGLEWIPILGL